MQKQAEAGDGRWSQDILQAYNRDLNRYRTCKTGEARELFRRMETACEPERSSLRDEIVVRNLRLVVKMAFRYLGQGRKAGLTVNDLIQEGSFGLMHAATMYDWKLGFEFSTYATNWIRQRITRAIQDFDAKTGGRVPVHVQEVIYKVAAERRKLTTKLARDPTPFEILQRIREVAKEKGQEPPSVKAIGRALKVMQRGVVSLDAPMGNDEESGFTLGSIIPDRGLRADKVQEAREELERITPAIKRIEAFVETQKPRTAAVLTLRLGLFGRRIRTLGEVGERYEVTRERIRQIEKKALEQLEDALGFSSDEVRRLLQIRENLQELIASSV